jgi:uncharacterized protein (TIGR02147 family)
MISVYGYLDYRAYLRDLFDDLKKNKPFFSFRYAAAKTGLDASNLAKILAGRRHLSVRAVPAIRKLAEFGDKEARYFGLLIRFNRARNDKVAREIFAQVMALQEPGSQRLAGDQLEFYAHWHHTALFALLDCMRYDGSNAQALAQALNPPLPVREARESLQLLQRLGLIERRSDGRFAPVPRVLTTGDTWKAVAIQQFQHETLKLAENALLNAPRETRDISTLTFSISRKDLAAAREITREYRKAMIKLAEASAPAEQVFQLNLQFFPLSR